MTDRTVTSALLRAFDPRRPLIDYIEHVARLRPDAPAILLRDSCLSYSQLIARAHAVAAGLRASGVKPGDFVGLAFSRSQDNLIAMLGTLRAGAGFVPLDPAYSDAAQLAQIVGQVPFAAILQAVPGPLPDGCTAAATVPVIALSEFDAIMDHHDWPQGHGEDAACMVFTSGTTGTPKGVVLANRGLAAFTLDQPVIGLRPDDIMLHASSLACDGGLIEVWLAFMAGAAVAVVEAPRPALPEIAATMTRHKVTVTSQYVGMHNLIVDHHAEAFATVRLAMAGGDVLSPDPLRRLKAVAPQLSMVNIYGPSETTCISIVQEIGLDLLNGDPIPIGRELTHEHAFVVDETLAELPDGTMGELLIGGAGVALGYYGMPARTAESFIDDPRPGQSGRVYRTGDMALRRADGVFEFFGRADRQIKLGGRRIELDGIEHVFRTVAGVHLAIVEAVTGPAGDKRIGLALQPSELPADETAFIGQVMEEARRTLHAELLPRHVKVLSELPVTKMGKPDRKAVRAAIEAQIAAGRAAAAPAIAAGQIRATVARVWDDILGCGALSDAATFFDAGGTSLQLIDAHARLERLLGFPFDLTLFFERPRLGDIAAELAEAAKSAAPQTAPIGIECAPAAKVRSSDIAVIGYAARVPGAQTLDAFWASQCVGANLIQRFTPEDLEDGSARRSDPNYVPARSVLDDVDMFDARFFNIMPREAEKIDPQARVFLEMCVAALDAAACDPTRPGGAIGVYAGSSTSTYMLHNLMSDRAALAAFTDGFQIDNYTTLTGNITDTLSTRVAYKLDLKGPAMTVHTACSTGLAAISQAVTALRAGQCDMALAGGISITFPQKRGYITQEGGMSSPDGLCRPFDAEAGGTVFGHGGGVLLLKPLAQALADGDRIEGVIRGVGLNNDGADKISFTAPSVTGQAGAIRAAHRDAGIAPSEVSFIECHGTATPLGDPIEVRALQQAFGAVDHSIALGSVKGSVGHLDAGAGAVSVIRTLQALKARQIPPMANFRAPNPRIDFASGPFVVPTRLQDWASDGPRVAGVSGFGVGGTNVHIVLQEAPETATAEAPEADRVQILPLSAKSPEALAIMTAQLATVLRAPAPPGLADVALTLQDGRTAHEYRLAVAAASPGDVAAGLLAAPVVRARPDAPPVAFLFPGQGAQYPGMGSGLYADVPVYARWIDQGCEILSPLLDRPLKPLLTDMSVATEAAGALKQTAMAQPALFLTQFATAQVWIARGVRPAAVLGHSVGEFAAAALSGIMSFEAALHAVAARGRLMQAQPAGVMLAVRAELAVLEPLMTQDVDLAAENAPKMQVVAGSDATIAALEQRLDGAGLSHRRLHTSHAFHSRMMEPVVAPLRDTLAAAGLTAPAIQVVSAVTGALMTDAEATDPDFWAAQARAPVRFARAVRTFAATAINSGPPVLLEVGAGNTLSTFAAQSLTREAHAALVQSLPDHDRAVSDDAAMASATATLWTHGVPVDWPRATRRGSRKLDLPGTVFMKKRHWVAAPVAVVGATLAAPAPPSAAAPMAAPSLVERPTMSLAPVAPPRHDRLTADLAALLTDLSGEDIDVADAATPFLELGFDSLFMGQMSQALAKTYGVEISFRSLLGDFPSIAAVAAHLDASLPVEVVPAEPAAAVAQTLAVNPAQTAAVAMPAAPTVLPMTGAASGDMASLMQSQMQVMQALFIEQLRVMGQTAPAAAVAPQPAAAAALPIEPVVQPGPLDQPAKPEPIRFGRAPALANAELTPEQQAFARDLAQRYSRKFHGSKTHTQENRPSHADPRTVAGFRAEWKELIFPLVAAKARGAYIEDVDGNRLIDLVNGFGTTAFGHAPDFVTKAVTAQMARGYPIGPQQDTAGPTARRFARFVGHERVTFCNTGSEAVMAAMRLARAVTGRKKIVTFTNDYHGQFDEVLIKAKARGEPGALPIAPGIPQDAVANMVVLPWTEPSALDWIRANVADIAAVVVEPVQSRHPELQPADFVRDIRRITQDGGAALVMDEVVTGFRTHARGMQGLWGIEADMATYGKVVSGGMPVGVLAGKRRFMDALDGGGWTFGDDSAPQVAPTFFAGTFVRHPLVIAAVDAVLDHLEREGDQLWSSAAARTHSLAGQMNAALAVRGLPNLVTQFSSWLVINTSQHDPRATLMFPLMRLEGVHVLEGFCGFLTTTHGEAECAAVLRAFETALDALQMVGILAPQGPVALAIPKVPLPAPVQVSGSVALTESQREIWMTHQLGDLPAASFNESVSMRIEGQLDRGVLGAALSDLVARHDALRARFARDGSSFAVTPPADTMPEFADISGTDAEAALREALAADARLPVDIVAGAAFRTMLFRLAPDLHVLVMTAHHIVCDGWSYNTLFTELAELYTARIDGRPATLAPAQSFAAYAQSAQHRAPDTAVRAYWKAQYADIPALPELPTDRPRPPKKSFAGATASGHIGPDLIKRLRKTGAKHGATLFSALFAGLQITLGRLAGSNQIVLGVPTGGQAKLDDPSLVGHLVNFLPIRADFDLTDSAASHLARVRDAVGGAFDHGAYTLGTLVRDLDMPRTLSRLPVTEVQFNLERVPEDLRLGSAKATVSANPKAAVNFDLFFNMVEGRDGLRIDVDYNTDLYDRATVERWIGHLGCILGALALAPEADIATLPLMPEADLREMAERWNRSTMTYERTALVQDLVAKTCRATPDAPAITDAAGTMSYAALLRATDALAAHIQSQVAGQNQRIGVAVKRGTGMVVAMLAVLKAGHAYVPVDTDLPTARQLLVLDTARVAAVVTADTLKADLSSGGKRPVINPAAACAGAVPAAHGVSSEDAAYVIFTSGSTGTPKGVEIPHRAVVNFLTSMAEAPGLWSADKLLAVTTVSFDIAALELFLPLTVGAEVEIATRDDVLDGFRLVQRLQRGDITVMQATPTLWGLLLEAGLEPSVDLRMLAGGEPLPADLAARLTANGATLWNLYGPTETTIWSALSRISHGGPVTIGAAVGNTELHVLDGFGMLCAPGQIGELMIGGDGLANGYFDRPDLTDAAFHDTLVAGRTVRLYHTGDLAARGADGSLRVLGRRDGQVKLRGIRIELGEIEARLRAEPGVTAAAVALKAAPGGQDRLVGYLVGTPDTSALAASLARQLPDYMVPTLWHELSVLPQTANGKLNRKALPDPDFGAARQTITADGAAETPTEKALAAIWADVLGLKEISVTETIFAMGIDSLAVFRLAARMIAKGHELEARHVLDNPSLRELAAYADRRGALTSLASKPSVKDFLRKRTGT
ncbi:MAG: amino acid adenylation domain-containing protein [bacterium]